MLSERETVLLWGSTWWLSGEEEVRFRNPKYAANALAEKFPNEKPSLRIVNQPTSLACVTLPFPNPSRLKLGATFSGEIAFLNDAACAWSWDGPFVRDGRREVTLHYEQQPGELGHLTRELESLGFEIESVWPLAPLLTALPAARRKSPWEFQPTAVLAINGDKVCGVRRISDAGLEHRSWGGPTAFAEAAAWLETFAHRSEERTTLVIEDPDVDPFDAHFQLFDRDDVGRELLTISEFLQEKLVLPRHHPAQLIPPPIFPE